MKSNLNPEEEEIYSKISIKMNKLTPVMFNYRYSQEKIYNVCLSLYSMQLIEMMKSPSHEEGEFEFAVRKF